MCVNKWKITKNDNSKINLKKLRDKCRLKYLISQDETFTLLCLLNLFIKIFFSFNQIIIKIDTDVKLIE
jgi:hypothetical protein